MSRRTLLRSAVLAGIVGAVARLAHLREPRAGLRKLDENVPPLNSKAAAAVMPPRPTRAGEVKKPETRAPEAPPDDE
jgi:hypothetical protein